MTITYDENNETKTVEFTVSGRVTQADYDEVIMPMQAFIDKHGTVKMIEIIVDFDGFESTVLWPGIKFDFRNIHHISHVAIVSDIGWIGPISKAAGAFMSTKLRTFEMSEVDLARNWIAAA